MKTYSDVIRSYRGGVYQNPYQGKDKKVVFICSMGILRSATGARLYSYKYNTRTAGTMEDALVPLSPALICWADQLVFVNQENYFAALEKYQDDEELYDKLKEAKVLAIPDSYDHMHTKLIEAYREQYEEIPSYALYPFGKEDA